MNGWQASLVLLTGTFVMLGAFASFLMLADEQCRNKWAAQGYEGRFVAGEGCKVKLEGKWLP